jgi:hypothetical protein
MARRRVAHANMTERSCRLGGSDGSRLLLGTAIHNAMNQAEPGPEPVLETSRSNAWPNWPLPRQRSCAVRSFSNPYAPHDTGKPWWIINFAVIRVCHFSIAGHWRARCVRWSTENRLSGQEIGCVDAAHPFRCQLAMAERLAFSMAEAQAPTPGSVTVTGIALYMLRSIQRLVVRSL